MTRRSSRGYEIDGYDFSAGELERSGKPLRRSLWPIAIALLVFALAVVRW